MSLIDDLNTINIIKANIKTAIENKGQTVTNFGSYPDAIENIVGTGSGQVKLFNTVENMQQSTENIEGDLAVVYRNEQQNANVNSTFQTAIFPTTIILPEAITDYIDIMYRATDNSVMFDCWGNLDANYFRMDCYTEEGSIRIQYQSSDGITYTRTDGGEETINFGTEIYYAYPEMWNDAIGYFIQTGGMYFEGLYRYDTSIKSTNYGLLSVDAGKYDVNNSYAYMGEVYYLTSELSDNVREGLLKYKEVVGLSAGCVYFNADCSEMYIVVAVNNNGSYSSTIYQLIDSNYIYQSALLDNVVSLKQFTYNLNTKEFTFNEVEMLASGSKIGNIGHYKPHTTETYILGHTGNDTYLATVETSGAVKRYNYTDNYEIIPQYVPAQNQFNLTNTNELLTGKTAYGKTGVLTGDGTIYDNLNPTQIATDILQVSEETLNLKIGGMQTKMKLKGHAVEDNCIYYVPYGKFTPGKLHYTYPFDNSMKDMIYLLNYKEDSLTESFAQNYNNKRYIYSPYYDTLLLLGCYSAGTASKATPIECIVINNSTKEVLKHTITSTTHYNFEDEFTFCYNGNVYTMFRNSSNTDIYKVDTALTKIATVSGVCYSIAVDEVSGILYCSTGEIYKDTVKAVNLTTGTITTVDSNINFGLYASKNYIVYKQRDNTILKWKRKGDATFTTVDCGILVDSGSGGIAIGEDNTETKIGIAINSSTTGESGTIILNTTDNTFLTCGAPSSYSTTYHTNTPITVCNDVVYHGRAAYVFAYTPDGISHTLMNYYMHALPNTTSEFYINVQENGTLTLRDVYFNTTNLSLTIREAEYSPRQFAVGTSNSSPSLYALDELNMVVIGQGLFDE